MFTTFFLDPGRAPGLACLMERPAMPAVGSLAGGFLAAADRLAGHDADFSAVLHDLVADPAVERILISRNPDLVLDHSLVERVMATVARLDAMDRPVVLATGGGLGLDDQRYCVLYSAVEPFLFFNRGCQPIIDTMIDLYLVDATAVRGLLADDARTGAALDAGFELALILHGYLELGLCSLFVPDLASGINGAFRSRDLVRIGRELGGLGMASRCPASVATLSGPLMLPPAPPPADAIGRPVPNRRPPLAQAIDAAIAPHLDPLSLSIVTRTQFRRMHLLRRMLATVSRSRLPDGRIEIVLSTDRPAAEAEPLVADLRRDFPHLTLTLAVNRRAEHSRVANLIGGVHAAGGDYIWFIDDDDYVDFTAFQAIGRCLFDGARPIIFGGSTLHAERWDLANPAHAVLAGDTPGMSYPGSGWRHMFAGVNQLPVCGAVIPRGFLLGRLATFDMRFDLSEDYTLYLLMLSASDLPPVAELGGTIAHISIRDDGDNSVTAPDRTQWTRDIAAYLHDLVHAGDPRTGGAWSILTQRAKAVQDHAAHAQIGGLQTRIRAQDAEIAGLLREVKRLGRLVSGRTTRAATREDLALALVAESRPAAALLAGRSLAPPDRVSSPDRISLVDPVAHIVEVAA